MLPKNIKVNPKKVSKILHFKVKFYNFFTNVLKFILLKIPIFSAKSIEQSDMVLPFPFYFFASTLISTTRRTK